MTAEALCNHDHIADGRCVECALVVFAASTKRAMSVIEVRVSDDSAKLDPELSCTLCGASLCDVEHRDPLLALCLVGLDHVAESHPGVMS